MAFLSDEGCVCARYSIMNHTMPAKSLAISLGTLAIIYVVHELQHPLPLVQCCATEIWIILHVQVIHFNITMMRGEGATASLLTWK